MVVAISVTGPENVPPHLKPQFIELKGAQVKELLDSLKHVLGTDFKRSLFPLIDTLSVERVLVGTGGACCESLMPLAFSLLVHHVRRDLSLAQLLEKGEVGKDQVTFRLKLELPFQVSPAAQGMHSQALASQSSVPLGFKGMREDEVWKAYGALRSGVHCLALFKGKDEVKEMLNSFSEFLAIMEPLYLVDMFSLCMPGLFDSLIYNKQLVQIFAELRQVPKLYKPFSDGLISLLVSIKLDVLKNPDYGAAKLILHLFICILGDDTKTQSDIERILQHHELVIMEVKDNKLVIMFTTSNCLFVTCNCSALCSYVSLDVNMNYFSWT
ncbi:uncharacterized protein LOC9312950 isoform X2 [Arabidopsis lyrata subsp. lyrata]|uniref:uncharacterized protein LOC9312950 isoform X2 n=1 Tax=Arabidopsis lyrata subsp. lyrata TaxID=81972 RepID=UPI000A29BF89|nr:uncharacterized protein LOC9312950 isoform X2 [Arabidopsis lyrata subsp. lyrata]|eukprot:XP_020879800.1 uncharacterized protein LOC9312950 isoform X2 [Arabidopsis lyrata subsp. lyrata]